MSTILSGACAVVAVIALVRRELRVAGIFFLIAAAVFGAD